MKILFIGDIIGRGGRSTVSRVLPQIKKELKIDLVVANVENAAAGFGMTAKIYKQLSEQAGIDFMTSGNHIWDKKEFISNIDTFRNVIRPANYSGRGVPGEGYKVIEVSGKKICIINLLGRVFLNWDVSSPFTEVELILDKLGPEVDLILVDFHAEATSEKTALANYLDGRVSLVVGTHTHVQTSDERILPKGTAYLTDLGMVGAVDSIIGMQKEAVIEKFLNGMPQRFQPQSSGQMNFNSLLVEYSEDNKAVKVERINQKIYLNEE